MPPLVTIGLPTRNRAGVIGPLLDSLLAQEYRNFELIISDNASTDDTADICERYAARDARIRVVRQETNIGLVGNHNFVLGEARGEYFCWSGDDDLYEPDFLSSLVAVLERDRSVGLAYCPVDWIDGAGRTVDRRVTPFHTEPAGGRFEEISRALWDRQEWAKITGVYRTEILRRCAPLAYNYGTQTDYSDSALCFEMSAYGALVGFPKILLHKRIGGVSMSPLYFGVFYHLNRLYRIQRQFAFRLGRMNLPWRQFLRLRVSILVRIASIAVSWRMGFLKSLVFTFLPPPLRRKLARMRSRRRALEGAGQ
jgi:glycosyltransferase involved in cell wall biosynthesis